VDRARIAVWEIRCPAAERASYHHLPHCQARVQALEGDREYEVVAVVPYPRAVWKSFPLHLLFLEETTAREGEPAAWATGWDRSPAAEVLWFHHPHRRRDPVAALAGVVSAHWGRATL
jgi:hypothetical protein